MSNKGTKPYWYKILINIPGVKEVERKVLYIPNIGDTIFLANVKDDIKSTTEEYEVTEVLNELGEKKTSGFLGTSYYQVITVFAAPRKSVDGEK